MVTIEFPCQKATTMTVAIIGCDDAHSYVINGTEYFATMFSETQHTDSTEINESWIQLKLPKVKTIIKQEIIEREEKICEEFLHSKIVPKEMKFHIDEKVYNSIQAKRTFLTRQFRR